MTLRPAFAGSTAWALPVMRRSRSRLPLLIAFHFALLVMLVQPLHAQGLPANAVGAIYPDNISWLPFPAFPPSVRLAILIGNPSKPEPFIIRVKVPAGVKLMPHRHPEDRIYTVISGVFYIGYGETFDPEKLQAYPPGSIIVLPGNTPHFHWAKAGEYVSQVSATGPLGLVYVDAVNDPRKK